METRKIVIVDSATNRRVDINTDATTFGELKRAASAAGIDYEGKDWLEGLTKSTPVSDDSLLPTNVMHKGVVTNNLVYMLTNTNKRIKSGAMTRSQMYAIIKQRNLGGEIKRYYGKCYSSVSSEGLAEYLAMYTNPTIENNAEASCTCDTPDCNAVDYKEKYVGIVNAFGKVFAYFPKGFAEDVANATKNLGAQEVEFTAEEIDRLFR